MTGPHRHDLSLVAPQTAQLATRLARGASEVVAQQQQVPARSVGVRGAV